MSSYPKNRTVLLYLTTFEAISTYLVIFQEGPEFLQAVERTRIMVSDSFFLEVTKQSGTKLLLQTVAIKPKETLQPIPTEEERGGREGKRHH